MQTTVTVAPNAPNETATVTVQPGYTGSSFICGNCNGGSPTGSNTASVNAEAPPPPIIQRNGSTISGQSTTVMAGEQAALAVVPPSGFSLKSQSWSFIQTNGTGGIQDISGGFTNCSGGQPDASCGIEAADPITTNQGITYYFVNPGTNETVTATVTYTLADGSASQSVAATATFDINGPTGTILPNTFVQTDDSATAILNPQNAGAFLKMTNAPGNPGVGIWFNDPATLPANNRGQFIWIQVLNSVNYNQLVVTGTAYSPPTQALNQLDGIYPYPPSTDVSTSDGPGRNLYSFFGEGAEAFDATMYVLWDPAIPPSGQSSCTPASVDTSTTPYTAKPSTCASIPVPLGSVRWKWGACSINALAPAANGVTTPSWIKQCGPGQHDSAAASGYPEWHSCYVSEFGGCK